MGSSSAVMLAAVLCAGMVCLGLGVLLLLWLTRSKDPYEGLPTTPPTLPAAFLQSLPKSTRVMAQVQLANTMDLIYTAKSDCWHVNHWIRVTLANILIDAAMVAYKPQNISKKPKELDAILQKEFGARMALSMKELGDCPGSTKVTFGPARPFGVDVGSQEVTLTLEQMLKIRDDFANGKRKTLM